MAIQKQYSAYGANIIINNNKWPYLFVSRLCIRLVLKTNKKCEVLFKTYENTIDTYEWDL